MVSKIPGYQNKEGGHEWEADSYIAEKADVEHLEGGGFSNGMEGGPLKLIWAIKF